MSKSRELSKIGFKGALFSLLFSIVIFFLGYIFVSQLSFIFAIILLLFSFIFKVVAEHEEEQKKK